MPPETILLTGARGLIGSWATRHFADEYTVVGVDRTVPPEETVPDGARFRRADCTDYGDVTQLLAAVEPDLVLHLAAVPHAGITTPQRTVSNNTLAAYTVLRAAAQAGVDCCWTSSDAVYGDGWAKLAATPVTEDSPVQPHNSYALSKVLGETVADYVVRRFGTTVASVRPTWVNAPGNYGTAATRAAFDPATTPADDIAAANLWSYIDVRDVLALLDALVDALTNGTITGHERFLAAAPETYLDRPTAAAVDAVFGQPVDVDGTDSVYDTTRTRERLGWEPTHSWHDAESEPGQTPPFRA